MKRFGSDKPRKFAPSAKPKGPGGKAPFKPRKPFGGEGRPGGYKPYPRDEEGSDYRKPASRPAGRGAGDRPSYGKAPRFGSEKPRFGDKPKFGANKPGADRFHRGEDAEGSRSSYDRPRPGGDKPAYGKKPYGSKPAYGSKPGYGSKPAFGQKPKFGAKPGFGAKPKFDAKPGFGSNRPQFEERGSGEHRNREDFQKPRYGERSFSDDRNRGGFKKPGFGGPGKPAGKFPKRDPYRVWKRDEEKSEVSAETSPVEPQAEQVEDDFISSGQVNRRASRHNKEWIESAASTVEQVTASFPSAPFAKRLFITMEDTRNVPIRVVWVFDTMVGDLPDGEPSAGETVYVHDSSNKFLGSAIYNPNSRIRARIFSLDKELFNQTYLKNAISKAIKLRRTLGYLEEGSCRVIFGESDGIPGLVADLIGGYLVIQPLTYAVDRHLPFIVDQLNEQVGPEGIVVRNDVPIRAKEGLDVGGVVTHGEIPERVRVKEAGYFLYANPASGQKTGMFLDQRKNRAAIKHFCKDARVLDLFCHVGGWAIRAARYGAAEVIGVDSSKPALELAKDAAEANGYDQVSFVDDDVFDYFGKIGQEEDNLFDVIICDPPAFAKTRAHFEEAIKAYLSLNYRAMKKLKPGGILVTCSCSQAVSSDEFTDMLTTAARNARSQFQIIEKRGAPQDHPVLLGLPETDYLKCFVLRKSE